MVINLRRQIRVIRRVRGTLKHPTQPVWRQRRRDAMNARRFHCLLNGEDVTSRTFYVDSRRGVVRLLKLNADGKPYVEYAEFEHWDVPAHLRPRVATEERRGRVQLIRR